MFNTFSITIHSVHCEYIQYTRNIFSLPSKNFTIYIFHDGITPFYFHCIHRISQLCHIYYIPIDGFSRFTFASKSIRHSSTLQTILHVSIKKEKVR